MTELLKFPIFYLKEILSGVARVTLDVVRPKPKICPAVIRLPIDGLSARQRLLLACLISMTPGSLSIGEAEAGEVMLIHCLYGANDPAAEVQHLQKHYYRFVKSLPI